MKTDGKSESERIREVYASYQHETVRKRWTSDNPGNACILLERRSAFHAFLEAAGMLPLAARRVLDVGCGAGSELDMFRSWGAHPANLYGVDLLEDRIAVAQQRYPDMTFHLSNAEKLAFPDGFFDVAVLMTVFSSIQDESMSVNIAREVARVLKPTGAILWYDMRYQNPRNPHVRPVSLTDLSRWFPGFHLTNRSITVLPPLVRKLGRFAPRMYRPLSWLVPLRTHYAALLSRMPPATRRA